MWKLVIEDDEGKRTVVPLTRDEYTIGRKEGNSIRLTERNVSRDHAKVTKRADPAKSAPIFTLADLTSYNGVYVNGLRVAEGQDLAHGDLIQIGDYRIVLQDETVPGIAGEEEPVALDTSDLQETVSNVPVVPSPLRATNATFLEKPNRLVVLAGPNPGEEFPLVGERLTIGRAEDATISINHNSVSRLHCEVHALGDARFEIVDKGSSNGVRVNGADLRRGIIEAGDVIELGDVKFKFVGEGQLFRPGSSESQQLAALNQRGATEVIEVRPASRSALLPAVLLGTVLALAVIGFFVLRPKPTPVPVATPDTSSSATVADHTGADAARLADARRMCDIGDVEGAHQKAGQLPTGSPLFASDDFKYIELKWSQMMMVQADSQTDPALKGPILQRLAGDIYADPSVKKFATAKLAALDVAAQDADKHPAIAAAPSSPRQANVPAVAHNAPPPPPPTPVVAPPPPHVTPRASSGSSSSLTDLATSANPADWQRARNILEPKVFGRRGSADEVRLLKAICKNQHDQQCVQQCAAELAAP
jgi:ABC transport system ATP-binding/permease protein